MDAAVEKATRTIHAALENARKGERSACLEAVLDLPLTVRCGDDTTTAVSRARAELAAAIEARGKTSGSEVPK